MGCDEWTEHGESSPGLANGASCAAAGTNERFSSGFNEALGKNKIKVK